MKDMKEEYSHARRNNVVKTENWLPSEILKCDVLHAE